LPCQLTFSCSASPIAARDPGVMELLAGGVAASGLLTYNRKNYFFDKEQNREKVYFSQEMKIKKHELYREDIRDLTDLTVSKMDVYMVINVLQLLFCVMLFTEGMPKPGVTPLWLHWILAATSGSGVLYFVLSIWLGMHASIAAHSFGVRLLTQFVRLPVPNMQQIHNAAAKAKDYEALSITEMLRIPVLQQQLRKLSATLGDLSQQEVTDTTGLEDNYLPEVAAPSIEETATLKHVQLYRDLQANWQAYDAYSRVSMAMGTNQLLQSINAYCLGVLLSETHSGWAAACCMAVISYVAWLIVRLDVLISWRALTIALALQLGTPLLTLCCIAAQTLANGILEAITLLVPLIFVLHFSWLLCCLHLATGHGDKVALPGKFRGVLYLDVFGWLSPDHAETPPDSSAQPEAQPAPEVQALPVAVYAAVADLCLRKKALLALQLEKWASPPVAEMQGESTAKEVARLRQLFNLMQEELQASLRKADDLPQEAEVEAPRVWLKLEWYSSGHIMEYWYDPDTGESKWSLPSEPDLSSDLAGLQEAIETLASEVKALSELIDQERQRKQQEQQDEQEQQPQRHLSPREEPLLGTASESSSQPLLRGSNAEAVPSSFYSASAAAPLTFQPENINEADHQDSNTLAPTRRPPGHLPWATFQQGTLALLSLWGIGVLWSSFHVFFGLDLSILPQSGGTLGGTLSKWVIRPDLDLRLAYRDWPHGHFRPQGLACGVQLGRRLFVAERLAVHQLVLPGGLPRIFSEPSSEEVWHPAVQQCLQSASAFQVEGIRSITLQCRDTCFLVLLGSGGKSLLSCPLRSGNATITELFGGPWQAVAATAPQRQESGLWAKARKGLGLVQLGSQLHRIRDQPQEHNASALVPLLEVEQDVSGAAQLAFLEDGRTVLGLVPNGTLLMYHLESTAPLHLRLPQGDGAEWLGLCSPGGREVFLVGRASRSSDFGIWRTYLPAWL